MNFLNLQTPRNLGVQWQSSAVALTERGVVWLARLSYYAHRIVGYVVLFTSYAQRSLLFSAELKNYRQWAGACVT